LVLNFLIARTVWKEVDGKKDTQDDTLAR